MNVSVSETGGGWFPDPSGLADERFFDGTVWTNQTRATPVAVGGWYDDPGGSGLLRFFDGSSWGQELKSQAEVAAELAATQESPLISPVDLAASTTALRTSRRSIAELKHSNEVLAPTVVEKSSRRFSSALLAVGGLMLIYALWVNVGTNWIGERGQADLRSQYQAMTADVPPVVVEEPVVEPEPAPEAPAPAEPAPEPVVEEPPAPPYDRELKPTLLASGTPTGVIKIPSIGMDEVFVSGTEVPDLKKGPGLWEYGAFPGTPGNATISGHRTTYGGPFRRIDELKTGDRITVSVAGQPDAVFEVRGALIVEPSRIQVTDDTPGVRLTLTTCEPVGSDAERLVVQAELVEGAWLDHAIGPDGWQIMS